MAKEEYILNGFVAFNRGSPEIDNMTFDENEARIKRRWGLRQEIKRCRVIIFKDD